MTQRDFQGIKDELTMDGMVYQKTSCISETLMEQGVSYPYVCSQITEDAIHSTNGKNIWLVLNKFAKRLSLKLDNEVQLDGDRFTMHFGYKVTAVGSGETHKYIPFTLPLSDGQMLTALVRNQEETAQISATKPMVVSKWILNQKDITNIVYKGGDNTIDMATTVNRLKAMIDGVHKKFVSENPQAKSLKDEINAMKIDLSNIVYEPEKSYAEKLQDMEERKNISYKVGDYVKVNSGYGIFHYGQITRDYSDATLYVGDKNGFEVTELGDLIKPEQMVKITKEEFEASHEQGGGIDENIRLYRGNNFTPSLVTEESAKKSWESALKQNNDNYLQAYIYVYNEIQGTYVATKVGDVYITGKGKNEIKREIARGDKLVGQVIPYIPLLLKNSTSISKEELTKDRKDFISFYLFEGEVVIANGTKVKAKLKAGVNIDDGKIVYHLRSDVSLDSITAVIGVSEQNTHAHNPNTVINDTISQKEQNVNIDSVTLDATDGLNIEILEAWDKDGNPIDVHTGEPLRNTEVQKNKPILLYTNISKGKLIVTDRKENKIAELDIDDIVDMNKELDNELDTLLESLEDETRLFIENLEESGKYQFNSLPELIIKEVIHVGEDYISSLSNEQKNEENPADGMDETVILGTFIGEAQLQAMKSNELKDIKAQMVETIKNMPKTYETDGQGDEAVAYLHYFKGDFNWYITEKDKYEDQKQAYGLADMGEPEMGYISIKELKDHAELDLYWTPKTIKDIKADLGTNHFFEPNDIDELNENTTDMTVAEVQLLSDEEFEQRGEALTDQNWHSEKVLFDAKRTGDKALIEEAQEIVDKHHEEGGLSKELLDERSALSLKIQANLNGAYGAEPTTLSSNSTYQEALARILLATDEQIDDVLNDIELIEGAFEADPNNEELQSIYKQASEHLDKLMGVASDSMDADGVQEDALSLPAIKINNHQIGQMTTSGQFEVEISTNGVITFEDKVVGKYNKATQKVTIVGVRDFTNPLVAYLSDNSFFNNETATSLKDKAYKSNKAYYMLEDDKYKLKTPYDNIDMDGIGEDLRNAGFDAKFVTQMNGNKILVETKDGKFYVGDSKDISKKAFRELSHKEAQGIEDSNKRHRKALESLFDDIGIDGASMDSNKFKQKDGYYIMKPFSANIGGYNVKINTNNSKYILNIIKRLPKDGGRGSITKFEHELDYGEYVTSWESSASGKYDEMSKREHGSGYSIRAIYYNIVVHDIKGHITEDMASFKRGRYVPRKTEPRATVDLSKLSKQVS
ncbi:MAG: defense against restriction DarA-related protein [Sulfurovaceae bacterium]